MSRKVCLLRITDDLLLAALKPILNLPDDVSITEILNDWQSRLRGVTDIIIRSDTFEEVLEGAEANRYHYEIALNSRIK